MTPKAIRDRRRRAPGAVPRGNPQHQQPELDEIVSAFDESCAVYRKALDAGSTKGLLVGPPAKPVFRKTI